MSFHGCFFQVYKLTSLYLHYNSNTEVFIDIPEYLNPPSVTLCFGYVDVIDNQRLRKDKFKSVAESEYPSYGNLSLWQRQSVLTISEILDYSPDSRYLFDKCSLLSPTDVKTYALTGKECYEKFHITKYYSQEYICYRIDNKSPPNLKLKFSDSVYCQPFCGSSHQTQFDNVVWSKNN